MNDTTILKSPKCQRCNKNPGLLFIYDELICGGCYEKLRAIQKKAFKEIKINE
jgi:hypothetical protein